MTSAIVYRESDFYIKNITTFTQYVLNLTGKGIDNKLITIMGEYHDTDMDCKKDKIVIPPERIAGNLWNACSLVNSLSAIFFRKKNL